MALILDTAAELLGQHGADGTTITAVAERSALSTSSIYEYVVGERELIGAVAERGLDRLHVDLVSTIRQPATIDEAASSISAALGLFLDRYRNEVGLRQALAFVEADPELSRINLADTRRNAAAVESVLAPLRPDADLGPAILLITHLSGSLAGLVSRVDTAEATTLIAEFERMIARSLSPR